MNLEKSPHGFWIATNDKGEKCSFSYELMDKNPQQSREDANKRLEAFGFSEEQRMEIEVEINRREPVTLKAVAGIPQTVAQKGLVEVPTSETITITELRQIFNKWLLMKKDWLVDLAAAIALNRLSENETSLWFFIIGTSGISKTEIVRALLDPQKITTKAVARLTKNTLISGNPKAQDLAPKLKGKLIITTDIAIFLKLDPHEKGLVWAQLRDLYDGYAGRQTGSGVDKEYSGIQPIAWVFCSTPIIDEELLLHQVLGTRELCFRLPNKWFNEDKVMERIWQNKETKKQMRAELNKSMRSFLEQTTELRSIKVPLKTKKKINKMAKLTTLLRASAQVDSYTGELQNFVYREMPTRVLEQFIELYCCLMNLDTNYPEDRAVEIMKHVCVSSIHPIRISVFRKLLEETEMSTTRLRKNLGLGWKTVIRELQMLKGIDAVEEKEEAPTTEYGKPTYYWKIKDSKNAKLLKNFLQEGQASLKEFESDGGGWR